MSGTPFGGSLIAGKRPALLVVDVVMAYLTAGSPLFSQAFGNALESAIRLVAAARAAGVPVVFTNVRYRADGRDGGLFYAKVPALKVFLEGSPLAEFPPSLTPHIDDVIVTKQYASAFFGTSLASTLHAARIDTVIVTGFSTSGCVRATALDALQNGFVPVVVSDACGDRERGPHDANLFDLQTKYAEVVREVEACAIITSVRRSS